MKKTNKILALPCLRGAIGDWIYYSTVIPFTELKRIDTEHKIKEDKELDKWLQRELSFRVDGIKNYLLNEKDRFFNSIIVGLYGALPDWYSLDLTVIEEKFDVQISSNVSESLGVLTLTGDEILFTIDGQHRIEAIKRALKEDHQKLINDELSVIFVGHSDTEEGFVKTRKLFATINREAKQPSKNDLAIIDETYAYNIIARMIYANYKNLKNKIALTDTYNLDRNDNVHFTNLLSIVEVNKKLFRNTKYKDRKYSSPTYSERQELYNESVLFFDFIINNIEEYKDYFSKNRALNLYRNSQPKQPLNLLFLPIGLNFLADIYIHFKKRNILNKLKNKINKIDFDLYEGTYKNIFFQPIQNRIILTNKTLAKNLTLYLLDEEINISQDALKHDLAKAYNINELSKEFSKLKLPSKV